MFLKITPFLLFLIIFIVLVISVVLGNQINLEGMQNKMPPGSMFCEANYYCPGDGTEIPCPTGTGSAPGSNSPSACKSLNYEKAGKYKDVHGNIQICPVGMYCPGNGNAIACPNGYTNTKTGLIDYADCLTTTIDVSKQTTGNVSHDKGEYWNYMTNSSLGSTTSPMDMQKDSQISNYFKWYWYWKNQTQPNNVTESSDYILKTQVVPPVCPTCPTCPSCPNSGICTNCGGQGGSGTVSTGGNSILKNANTIASDTSKGIGQAAGNIVHGVGDFTGGVIGGTGEVVGGALHGTGEIVGGAAKGVGDIAGGVVKGAGGIIGGTVNAAGEIVGGTIKGIEKIGKSVNAQPIQVQSTTNTSMLTGPMITSGQLQQQQQLQYQPNQQQQITPYYGTQYANSQNYFNALPQRGSSDFIPLTTDFSSFSK